MIWASMREAALWRHWWVNQVLEHGCPWCWQRHLAMIRAIYGF